MPEREISPESPSPPTSITGFETAIEYVKMKRRQPLEMLTPRERESLFLTEKVFNTSSQPSFYLTLLLRRSGMNLSSGGLGPKLTK